MSQHTRIPPSGARVTAVMLTWNPRAMTLSSLAALQRARGSPSVLLWENSSADGTPHMEDEVIGSGAAITALGGDVISARAADGRASPKPPVVCRLIRDSSSARREGEAIGAAGALGISGARHHHR